MSLSNLTQATNVEVEHWLFESIPELSEYQKDKIWRDEIVRSSDLYFFKQQRPVPNKLLRLTIFLLPFAFIILLIFIPFRFLFTGIWGYDYDYKPFKFYQDWINKLVP